MSIAEPNTGVMTASALNISKTVIDINGIIIRLFLIPGIVSVRRVTSKFVKDIVVLIPA